LVAECEFGCQYGAKNTLDLNYLRQAEKLEARVQPNSHVTRIVPDKGGYLVYYTNLLSGSEIRIRASRVVIAAGTLGTNEILLRCRDVYQTLPLLSKKLGQGYSCNGDFLGTIQNSQNNLQPWHGPDVTSIIRYFESPPEFTMAAPTFNQPVMEVLASHGQISGKWLRPVLHPFWPSLNRLTPIALKKGLFSQPGKLPGPNAGDPSRMTNLFAIGRDNAGGLIHLTKKGIDVKWDFERENAVLIRKMTEAMQEVAEVYGGTFSPLVTWNLFRRTLTFHSLGGCPIADTSEKGVVSPEGEVFQYPGLFVADGSVIPTSLGFHPAMTISAVAEKIAEAVVRSF
jgi:cholesterol oxidase